MAEQVIGNTPQISDYLLTDDYNVNSSQIGASSACVKTAVNDMNASLDSMANVIGANIGSIITLLCSDTYVPLGTLPLDGSEYSADLFQNFYTNFLISGRLLTCTYAEFSTQLASTGNCAKFAVDTVNRKFRVPMLKDGDSITQATSAAELGKSVKAGLPNVKGDTGANWNNTTLLSGPFYAGATNSGLSGSQVQTLQGVDFNLSLANQIYRDDVNTVLTEQVRLRHFVVVASAQNNASVFDWSNYMAALAVKANNDLSNLTPAAKMSLLGILVMTGSITLNGTTDNTVVMTDIVPELGLEIGDVIRIDTGAYNKLHTVESITNNGSIIVNYEHAGNRGNGSLKLPNFTGQATVTRVAKWFNAPIGLGQAWVGVTASRAFNITYTNTTGRSISIYIKTELNADAITLSFVIGSSNLPEELWNGDTQSVTQNVIVPPAVTYRTNCNRGMTSWWELR